MDGSVCSGDRNAEAGHSRKHASVWSTLLLIAGVSLFGCARYSDIGVFQDRSGNWFAYALSGGQRGVTEVA